MEKVNKKERKIAVLDVDSILWPFDKVIYNLLVKDYPQIKSPKYWDIWQFYNKYNIAEEDFYRVVNEIHENQEKYKPFPFASEFSKILKKNYYVIIASNRIPKYRKSLKRWLDKNNIVYDRLYVNLNKHPLYKKAFIAIDDGPYNLIKADEEGCIACGVLCPWNKFLEEKFLLSRGLKRLSNLLRKRGLLEF